MTLLQLTYFCEVVKTMNFNETARYLNISQPTLSKSIATLEKELGVMLFERKGRHVELTHMGELYYQEVSIALDQIYNITEKVQELSASPQDCIHIAHNPPFGQGAIPKMIGNFLRIDRNNNSTITMNSARSSKIEEGLISGKYDVAFCTIDTNNPDLEYVPLMTQSLVVITSLDHPFAKAGLEEITIKEIKDEIFIDYIKEAGIAPLIERYKEDNHVRTKSFCTAQDERSIASLVMSGLGVAIVAQVPELKEFEVKQMKLVRPECNRIVYMVYHRRHYKTPAMKRFIRYIMKEVKDAGVTVH